MQITYHHPLNLLKTLLPSSFPKVLKRKMSQCSQVCFPCNYLYENIYNMYNIYDSLELIYSNYFILIFMANIFLTLMIIRSFLICIIKLVKRPISCVLTKYSIYAGAHTFGFAQCFTFKPRLFNFGGSGKSDPSLDSSLLQNLQKVCPNQADSDSNLAPLDPVTTNTFDNTYYKNVLSNSGLLQSDQALLGDNTTSALVTNYSKWPILFFRDFAVSVEKMGRIGVLTGQQGQIRKNCRAVN